MEFETIRLRSENGVSTIELARPDCGNAISVQMVEELRAACHHLEDESADAVVVVRGAGETFCAGIDLGDFPLDRMPDVGGFSKWEQAVRDLERLPKIVVAAVDGGCCGGGLQLALACDVRIATGRAEFRLPELQMGFLPGLATFRLAKYVGVGRARHLALTGRAVDSDEALRIGLIDRVCARTGLDAAIGELVEEVRGVNPDTALLLRRLLDESFAVQYEDFIGSFLAAQHRAIQGEAFRSQVGRKHAADRDGADDEGE